MGGGHHGGNMQFSAIMSLDKRQREAGRRVEKRRRRYAIAFDTLTPNVKVSTAACRRNWMTQRRRRKEKSAERKKKIEQGGENPRFNLMIPSQRVDTLVHPHLQLALVPFLPPSTFGSFRKSPYILALPSMQIAKT
ncbi:hypothetical protein LY78DRAFT_365652 [Colletotrichum sublineola]|nr:hypothetical protein LY78DRAFT_365652 [Colletotrichum sublineola]